MMEMNRWIILLLIVWLHWLKKKNVTRTQIALAWPLHQPQVAAPIIGATKITHLEEAIQAFDVELTKEDLKFLEEEYTHHKVVGAL